MGTTIHKRALEAVDRQTVLLPGGATILTVQVQRDVPCIWYRTRTDPIPQGEPRVFEIYGTGHEIEGIECLTYVGTFQLHGSLVFHLFERVV